MCDLSKCCQLSAIIVSHPASIINKLGSSQPVDNTRLSSVIWHEQTPPISYQQVSTILRIVELEQEADQHFIAVAIFLLSPSTKQSFMQ